MKKTLIQQLELEQIHNKCTNKIKHALNFAGRGEILDIVWQEQVSRERVV